MCVGVCARVYVCVYVCAHVCVLVFVNVCVPVCRVCECEMSSSMHSECEALHLVMASFFLPRSSSPSQPDGAATCPELLGAGSWFAGEASDPLPNSHIF